MGVRVEAPRDLGGAAEGRLLAGVLHGRDRKTPRPERVRAATERGRGRPPLHAPPPAARAGSRGGGVLAIPVGGVPRRYRGQAQRAHFAPGETAGAGPRLSIEPAATPPRRVPVGRHLRRVQARGVRGTMANRPMTADDPLSTDAQPAPHQAPALADPRRGPGRGRPPRRQRRELSANGLTWIHLDAPDQEVSTELAERFGWHPLDVEDVHSKRQRPKIDEYPGYIFGGLPFPFYHNAGRALY